MSSEPLIGIDFKVLVKPAKCLADAFSLPGVVSVGSVEGPRDISPTSPSRQGWVVIFGQDRVTMLGMARGALFQPMFPAETQKKGQKNYV